VPDPARCPRPHGLARPVALHKRGRRVTAHLYSAYGLVVAMPFAFRDLKPADPASIPDVRIAEGPVPVELPDAPMRDADLDVARDAYLLRCGPAGARILVERGRTVTFQREANFDEGVLRHVLLHQVMAALLRQRGMLVLHASGALSPRGVVLVGGASGAGKSTTTAALTQLGWPLQSDDVSALHTNAAGGVDVVPGATDVHLFEAATAALSLETRGLAPNPGHRMKIAVPAPVEATRIARPLYRIVHLEKGARFRVEKLTGQAKLALLLHAIYGPYLPDEPGIGAALVSRVLQTVEMIRIVRPEEGWTMDAVVAAIAGE